MNAARRSTSSSVAARICMLELLSGERLRPRREAAEAPEPSPIARAAGAALGRGSVSAAWCRRSVLVRVVVVVEPAVFRLILRDLWLRLVDPARVPIVGLRALVHDPAPLCRGR